MNQRAELLQTDDLISGAALDKYRFIRDGFLQRRRSLVYDGSPPPAADDTSPPSPGGAPAADSNVKKELVPPQSEPAPTSK